MTNANRLGLHGRLRMRIVGAIAGGIAQNISFLIGPKALLIVAMMFYNLAVLFGQQAKSRTVKFFVISHPAE